MVKRDHLFWHHICHKNGIKHTWDLYEKGRRSALGQLGRCACTAFWTCWRCCKGENFRHHCYLYNNDYRLHCRAKDPTIELDCHGPPAPNNFKKIKLNFKNAHRSAFDIQFWRSHYEFDVYRTNKSPWIYNLRIPVAVSTRASHLSSRWKTVIQIKNWVDHHENCNV